MDLLNLQSDPAAFRASLLIDTDAGPKPFEMDPWQRTDFLALDAGWMRAVVGSTAEAQYQRGWLERARGHSKSLDLGVMAAWALFASRRRLSGIAAAGDQDQARILRDAIGRLTYINPWLSRFLEVTNNRVTNPNTGSTLDIITSDAPTSYGLTPDFVIADEVVHWRKRDLWDSLLSSAAKRSTCMLVCISNAGLSDDWTWKLREAVRTDPSWYFSRLEGPVASWITQDRLAEQQRLLPSIAYRRLWLNEWTTGGGDALTEEDIKLAFRSDLRPMTSATSGYEFVAGLDLGVSRDASAICVLGVHRQQHPANVMQFVSQFHPIAAHGKIRLAYTKIWRPVKGTRVNLSEVEAALLDLHKRFNLRQLNYDPWEMRAMAARLQSAGLGTLVHGSDRRATLPMVEITPTGKNLQAIATATLEAFADRRLELFEDPDLRRDLSRLRVEERQYGFRLVSPRDEFGHGDLGNAFSLALLAASDLAAEPLQAMPIGPAWRDDSVSDWQQAVNRARHEAEQFKREQDEWIKEGNDHSFATALKLGTVRAVRRD